jgi:hypothetical protein
LPDPTGGTGTTSFSFTPSTPVAAGRNITATAARISTSETSEFSAPVSVQDAIAPTVVKVVPGEGATGVSTKANVSAFFSDAMNPSSVDAKTMTLKRAGTSRKVAARITYDPTTKKATLNPKANLAHGASYTATVSTGARDLAGNALDQKPSLSGVQSKVWKFKVRK